MYIRQIDEDELKYDNIINKEDFPEVIHLDSDSFKNSRRTYLDNCKWYGLFEEDEEIKCVCCVSNKVDDETCCLELLECQVNNKYNGYGTILTNYVIDLYTKKGFKQMKTMCMYRDLTLFYKRFGFEVENEKRQFIKMVKKL